MVIFLRKQRFPFHRRLMPNGRHFKNSRTGRVVSETFVCRHFSLGGLFFERVDHQREDPRPRGKAHRRGRHSIRHHLRLRSEEDRGGEGAGPLQGVSARRHPRHLQADGLRQIPLRPAEAREGTAQESAHCGAQGGAPFRHHRRGRHQEAGGSDGGSRHIPTSPSASSRTTSRWWARTRWSRSRRCRRAG